MRTKKPQPYDPQKQYNPGERSIYRGMVIVAERWTKIKEEMANQPGNIYPKWRCSLCVIDGKNVQGFATSTVVPIKKEFISKKCMD